MSRDGPASPTPNPMSAMSAASVHPGIQPEAISNAHSAAKPSAPAMSFSWPSPFEAKNPPVAMPAALPSR